MIEPIRTEEVFSTPWFSLIARTGAGERDPHYAIRTDDYVAILALTRDEKVLLVRQYRHAVEGFTLELPSGHVDRDETPEEAARRELLEETGCRAAEVEPLGCLRPDTGRLANRMWCFFARDVESPGPDHRPEHGIEATALRGRELAAKIRTGEFDHALHHAVLMLATFHGRFALGHDSDG